MVRAKPTGSADGNNQIPLPITSTTQGASSSRANRLSSGPSKSDAFGALPVAGPAQASGTFSPHSTPPQIVDAAFKLMRDLPNSTAGGAIAAARLASEGEKRTTT